MSRQDVGNSALTTTAAEPEAPVAALEFPLLSKLAAAVMKRGGGKYRRPKRFGRAVATLARLYGLLRLEQLGRADLVTSAELLDLQKQLKIVLEDGDLARLDTLIAEACAPKGK